MNASNQLKQNVEIYTRENIKLYFKSKQKSFLKELKSLNEKLEIRKQDYLNFLRFTTKEYEEYFKEEDYKVSMGLLAIENSSKPEFKDDATEEQKQQVMDVLFEFRKKQGSKIKRRLCLDSKNQIEYIENTIRFWVSLRQEKYKSAVKYHNLCEEYELFIIDSAVDGNLHLRETNYENNESTEIKGETEISRLSCEYFGLIRNNRKTIIDAYPKMMSHNKWWMRID